MDSSSAVVCSGEVPCLEGRAAARDSFSTCVGELWCYSCGVARLDMAGAQRADGC